MRFPCAHRQKCASETMKSRDSRLVAYIFKNNQNHTSDKGPGGERPHRIGMGIWTGKKKRKSQTKPPTKPQLKRIKQSPRRLKKETNKYYTNRYNIRQGCLELAGWKLPKLDGRFSNILALEELGGFAKHVLSHAKDCLYIRYEFWCVCQMLLLEFCYVGWYGFWHWVWKRVIKNMFPTKC